MDDLTKDHYDAIVIGSGPGGATIARDLTRQGKRVLILERGHGNPIWGTIRQSFGYSLIPGQSLLFTPQMLSLVRDRRWGQLDKFLCHCLRAALRDV